MKFIKTISKNFRILFKLKLSLLAIILGPLFILFLIGFAFNSSSNIELSVGYVDPDGSALTQETIAELDANYIVKGFDSNESCIRELELSLMHTCIIFPENFVVENEKTNNIVFFVDKSRINLVYNVIDSVSEKIGFKSDELSKTLTDTLISTLAESNSNIDDALSKIITSKLLLTAQADEIDSINEDLDNADLDTVSISLDFESEINDLVGYTTSIRNTANEASSDGLQLVDDLRGYGAVTGNSNVSDLVDDLETLFEDMNSSVTTDYSASQTEQSSFLTLIEDAKDQIEEIEDKLSDAKTLTQDTQDKLESVKSSLNQINNDLDSVKSTLEQISNDINTIEITSTDQIVNPITTTIETISSDQNQLIILFPYVLILIIMFVGLMLSSTLVIVEKKSKAAFRVFTTPTKDGFFVMTTFITAFIIVFLQTLAILLAMYLLGYEIILPNIAINLTILILAMFIFIFLGMAVGYLMPNQQGSNMTTITIGAVLLFISNIVVPLETISEHLKLFAVYNPYVIASETLRKSILFTIPIESILREVITLGSYSIIILMFILMIQQFSKARYFNKKPKSIKHKKVDFSHKYIFMHKTKISNEKEFIKSLNEMSDKEYKKYLFRRKKQLKKFFETNIHKPNIAKDIKKYSRKSLLEQLVKENKEIVDELKQAKEEQSKTKK